MSLYESGAEPALTFDDVSVVRGGRTIWSDSTLQVDADHIVRPMRTTAPSSTVLAGPAPYRSLTHLSEPTRQPHLSYALTGLQ